MPFSFRTHSLGLLYGRHLHAFVRLHAERKQSFGTFFLRNRAELQLICRLLKDKEPGSRVKISVVACSKGAEVYSINWALRSARPDLKFEINAVDISNEILEFAKRGAYSRRGLDSLRSDTVGSRENVTWNTCRDQNAPIFERMTVSELQSMCDVEGDQCKVKPWLKEGIRWLCGDANNPELVRTVGAQDLVVANRFLCHMAPRAAESCLLEVARLVKPGGYLFVCGVDLDVRTRIAKRMNWRPVTDLIREVHEGDISLRKGWPLEYWGLEPLQDNEPDWQIRYASTFQIG
jgi:chemotaxis methyl-accepting protein methylase